MNSGPKSSNKKSPPSKVANSGPSLQCMAERILSRRATVLPLVQVGICNTEPSENSHQELSEESAAKMAAKNRSSFSLTAFNLLSKNQTTIGLQLTTLRPHLAI